jgi:hypothetical protein
VPGSVARHAAARGHFGPGGRPLGLRRAMRAEPSPGTVFRLVDLGTKVLVSYALGGTVALAALGVSPGGPRFFARVRWSWCWRGAACGRRVPAAPGSAGAGLAAAGLGGGLARRPRPGPGRAAIPYLLFLLPCVSLAPVALEAVRLPRGVGGSALPVCGWLMAAWGTSAWCDRTVRAPYLGLLPSAMEDGSSLVRGGS